ncbi:hypothetical protein ACLQ2R_10515 [Streptosporangium sp. DT93]|uniref:hypothetical protein n=1 Tax=Streptosporangium sp. DT93 TaxID=3393428 RepID=UPI003CF37A9E
MTIPIARRVRVGRRVLLTLGPADADADAEAAVAWATRLRSSRLVEGYALAPATLEDVYLAATAEATPGAAVTPQETAHA